MSGIIKDTAIAITAADKTAPDPHAPILWGAKRAEAWEARQPMAEAALRTILAGPVGDVLRPLSLAAEYAVLMDDAASNHDEIRHARRQYAEETSKAARRFAALPSDLTDMLGGKS